MSINFFPHEIGILLVLLVYTGYGKKYTRAYSKSKQIRVVKGVSYFLMRETQKVNFVVAQSNGALLK